MKLIVGLGNPGKQFDNTRHNVGFMIIDNYIKSEKMKNKFNGLYFEKDLNGEKTIFLKPQSFMNLSGEVVAKYISYFKVSLNDVLIIRDDLDLEIGTAKIKFNSSSGGDNGIKSIITCLGSQAFYQFKVGISRNKNIEPKNYVLSQFTQEEINTLKAIIDNTKEIIDYFIMYGGEKTINRYNRMIK